jgi:hypothetical protein
MALYSHPALDVLLDIASTTVTLLAPALAVIILVACLSAGAAMAFKADSKHFGGV